MMAAEKYLSPTPEITPGECAALPPIKTKPKPKTA
jgi:hypothetical protein